MRTEVKAMLPDSSYIPLPPAIHMEGTTVMHAGRKHYISEYASGWRWAVIEDGRRVVARGLADTYAAAVAKAAAAELATDEKGRPSRSFSTWNDGLI